MDQTFLQEKWAYYTHSRPNGVKLE